MSKQWEDFFEEPADVNVDRHSGIFADVNAMEQQQQQLNESSVATTNNNNNGIEAITNGADDATNMTLDFQDSSNNDGTAGGEDADEDLGAYSYDYTPPATQQNPTTDSSTNNHRDYSKYEQPVDEGKLNASIAASTRTERRKSRNANLEEAFRVFEEGDEDGLQDANLHKKATPNDFIPPNHEEDTDFYDPRSMDKIPLWKQLANFACMSVSVVLIPWSIYALFVCFWVSFGMNFDSILPFDFVIGISEVAIASVCALICGALWNALSIVACRMLIRRVLLPAIYIITLLALSGVVVFLILSWQQQYTAKYSWGIILFYIVCLVIIVPVWIFRFIRQEFMIRFFAKRILVYLWKHKITIPMIIACVLAQSLICFMVFIFNGFWLWTIPVGLIAMDVIRNCMLYAICRMDRHYLEEGKSSAALSLSFFFEASVFKTFWIVLGSILSFFSPFVVATRSIALAILTACVSYNYILLFIYKTLSGEEDPEKKKQKTLIAGVLALIFGVWILLGVFLSFVLTILSIIYYVLSELLLIIISRGVIASMAFHNENWPQAVWRKIKIQLRSAFFTHYPLSEAETVYDKTKFMALKLVSSIGEVSEANNVLLYFCEMGSVVAASVCGVIGYWWLHQMAPRDEENMQTRRDFYPYYQAILVCFAIGYFIASTSIQFVEARVHSLSLCLKHKNNSLLSKFTKIKEETLDAAQQGVTSELDDVEEEDRV